METAHDKANMIAASEVVVGDLIDVAPALLAEFEHTKKLYAAGLDGEEGVHDIGRLWALCEAAKMGMCRAKEVTVADDGYVYITTHLVTVGYRGEVEVEVLRG